jgi:hypothetical protein
VQERIAKIAHKYKTQLLRGAGEWVLPLCLVLVGLTAFGLGRLSVIGEEGPRLIVRLPDGTTQTAATYAATVATKAPVAPEAAAGEIVASKNGTKYYTPGCSGSSRIKEENKVFFATIESAEAAGYSKAANCQ